MAARVQIEIEANDQASAVLRGITSAFGPLGGAVADLDTLFSAQAKTAQLSVIAMDAVALGADNADEAVRALAQAENEQQQATVRLTESLTSLAVNGLMKVGEFLKSSFEDFQEYAGAVRDVALASGQSADEASRMLQVLDDFQISAQDVTAATRAMTKEGLTPTIETLASLSDQYLQITDAQERNEFVIKNLGRAGLQWVNMLNQGGDALRSMAGEIDQNLILNDEMIKKAEQERLAMDALADSWQGFKVQVGAAVGDMILANQQTQEQVDGLQKLDEIAGKSPQNYRFMTDAQKALVAQMERGKAMTEFYTQSVEANSAALNENAAAVQSIDYKSLIGDIQSYQSAIDDYTQTNDSLMANEDELMEKRKEVTAQLSEAVSMYGQNSQQVATLRGELAGVDQAINANSASVAANAEQYKQWAAQTVFAFAQARAAADGNISEIEGTVLIEAGQALGLFDEKTANVMQSVNESFETLDPSNAEEVIDNLQKQLEALVNQPYVINITTNAPTLDTGSGAPPGTGNNEEGGATGLQMGGMAYAASPYMVGEAGAEPFFPATNGRVLGHAESLHALTVGGRQSQVIYIYGPVTVTNSGDDAKGWMEIR